MAGEALLQVMRSAAKGAIPQESRTDLIYGNVTGLLPIRINIENRFEVDESMLVLSPWCYDKTITLAIPAHGHDASTMDLEVPAHEHMIVDEPEKKTSEVASVSLTPSITISTNPSQEISIRVWDGLKIGDKVALLRVASGQQYIVLFKVGD